MGKLIDLTGQTFYSLTVLGRAENQGKKVMWKCKCECGKETTVYGTYLRNGHTKSCGCRRAKVAQKLGKNNLLDLTGKTFGFLTVIKDSGERIAGHHVVWECQCECGAITKVAGTNLKNGNVKSCGCKKMSYGEYNISQILDKYNIQYIKEFCVSELNKARFDFAILENDKIIRIVEYDGQHHYKEISFHKDNKYTLEQRQQRDKIKNEWAAAHNIPLVRIPYWERDNITLEMIMSDKYLVR